MKLLRKIIREIASILIRYCGIPFVIRNTIAKNKVTIISYHNPKPDILDKHLKYLSKHYNFITLDLLTDAIYSKNRKNIPKKSLVVTLDDGHKSNFMLLDIFKKYKVKPTIFICSQIVNTNRKFWFKVPGIDLKRLIKYSNIDKLHVLDKNFGFSYQRKFSKHEEREALNFKEIMLMKDFIDFQSHSRFHPILTSCTDDESGREILESKKEIEALSGKVCKHFAYPNGYYSEREIEFLKKSGYLSARTIDMGWNGLNANPYKLKINGITDDASVNMMVAQLSGLTLYLQYLMKGKFNGNRPQSRN